MIARRLSATDPALGQVLDLIRAEFAYMDGVINPPSSMHRLTLQDLADGPGEVWVIGQPVEACVVLTPKPETLYIGKLAVAQTARLRRLGSSLVNTASDRAADLGLGWLELETRIELVANQAVFAAMGFVEFARTAHPGFGRHTSITYRRKVQRPFMP